MNNNFPSPNFLNPGDILPWEDIYLKKDLIKTRLASVKGWKGYLDNLGDAVENITGTKAKLKKMMIAYLKGKQAFGIGFAAKIGDKDKIYSYISLALFMLGNEDVLVDQDIWKKVKPLEKKNDFVFWQFYLKAEEKEVNTHEKIKPETLCVCKGMFLYRDQLDGDEIYAIDGQPDKKFIMLGQPDHWVEDVEMQCDDDELTTEKIKEIVNLELTRIPFLIVADCGTYYLNALMDQEDLVYNTIWRVEIGDLVLKPNGEKYSAELSANSVGEELVKKNIDESEDIGENQETIKDEKVEEHDFDNRDWSAFSDTEPIEFTNIMFKKVEKIVALAKDLINHQPTKGTWVVLGSVVFIEQQIKERTDQQIKTLGLLLTKLREYPDLVRLQKENKKPMIFIINTARQITSKAEKTFSKEDNNQSQVSINVSEVGSMDRTRKITKLGCGVVTLMVEYAKSDNSLVSKLGNNGFTYVKVITKDMRNKQQSSFSHVMGRKLLIAGETDPATQKLRNQSEYDYVYYNILKRVPDFIILEDEQLNYGEIWLCIDLEFEIGVERKKKSKSKIAPVIENDDKKDEKGVQPAAKVHETNDEKDKTEELTAEEIPQYPAPVQVPQDIFMLIKKTPQAMTVLAELDRCDVSMNMLSMIALGMRNVNSPKGRVFAKKILEMQIELSDIEGELEEKK